MRKTKGKEKRGRVVALVSFFEATNYNAWALPQLITKGLLNTDSRRPAAWARSRPPQIVSDRSEMVFISPVPFSIPRNNDMVIIMILKKGAKGSSAREPDNT